MKIPRFKPGDAIEIIWTDSHYLDKGWMDEVDAMGSADVTIRSVCQYLSRDKTYICTVSDRSEAMDGVMRDLKIPIGCIKQIRRLT
jgi:predicted DNA-binding ArsR family transcriptional regulator